MRIPRASPGERSQEEESGLWGVQAWGWQCQAKVASMCSHWLLPMASLVLPDSSPSCRMKQRHPLPERDLDRGTRARAWTLALPLNQLCDLAFTLSLSLSLLTETALPPTWFRG